MIKDSELNTKQTLKFSTHTSEKTFEAHTEHMF